MVRRQIIAIDLDDVLCDFTNPFLEFLWKEGWSYKGHRMERGDIAGSFTESGAPKGLIHRFSVCETGKLLPDENAIVAIHQLSKIYTIICVTARPPESAPETFGWIRRNFPKIVGTLLTTDKGQACEAIGATVLIEDQLRYACQWNSLVLAKEWNVEWEGKRGDWNWITKQLIDR